MLFSCSDTLMCYRINPPNDLHELRGGRASSPGIDAGVAHRKARANSHVSSMQMLCCTNSQSKCDSLGERKESLGYSNAYSFWQEKECIDERVPSTRLMGTLHDPLLSSIALPFTCTADFLGRSPSSTSREIQRHTARKRLARRPYADSFSRITASRLNPAMISHPPMTISWMASGM